MLEVPSFHYQGVTMTNPNRQPPRSLLKKATQFFNELRAALVSAGRALKELRSSIQQMILLCIAICTVLDNEAVVHLFRRSIGWWTGG